MKSSRHSFKWMVYEGEKVRIDRDIAPLMATMWELGIKTTSSCQGTCSAKCKHKFKIKKHKGGVTSLDKITTPSCRSYVWVAFASARDMERFYNLVAVYEKWERGQPTSMYELINGWGGRDVKRNGQFHHWESNPDNWEVVHHIPNRGIRGHWKKFANDIPGESKFYTAWEEDDCPRNNFRMEPQIKFPHKHLEYVMERLQAAKIRGNNVV